MPSEKSNRFSLNFSIGKRKIGECKPAFIIAEAGVAHFGSMKKAFRLIDLAAEAGADAVKFQVFKTDELISKSNPSWQKRYKEKELPFDKFYELKKYSSKRGIIFLATAHDEVSLDFLDKLDVSAFKIGSGEIYNWDFIRKIASRRKPVILSTGMYTFADIAKALGVIHAAGNKKIIVLHCITSYPTQPSEVNLRVMHSIREKFNVLTGYSDHTEGFHIPLAAAALGASVIEKHITLDFDVAGAQDWKVSCGADDLRVMVRHIRDIEKSLGNGIRSLSVFEKKNLKWARKSLVASKFIKKGQIISEDALGVKRPGTGIKPYDKVKILGKKASKNIAKDSVIKKEHLK